MKSKKERKLLSVIFAASMAISALAGCGTTTTSTTGNTVDNESSEVADESRMKVNEITFPLAEPMEFDVFVYASTTGGGTYQENYVTDWIKEKTNIQLNFVYDVDGDDAKTKLNLVMADPNNMPDIFWATGWTKSEVQAYGQQGLLLPLEEYLESAPNWNKLNEISPARRADLTMTDGHIYTFGDENEAFHTQYQNRMWIYKPWVDLLNGGKMPETTDELYNFLKAVKEQDPNGNGKADEIPITGHVDDGWAMDPTVWIMNAFVQCNNPLSNSNPTIGGGFTISPDGKIEYAVMKDAYREAVAFINKLYQEGLLDQQTFTQDNKQFRGTLDNPENLVALHPGGLISADQDKLALNQDGKWKDWVILEPVAGPNGVRLAAKNITSYFGAAHGLISANCENPEIAIALFDFLATEEGTNVQSYGPEGYGWVWTEEGISLDGGTPRYQDLKIPKDFDWLANGFDKAYGENAKYVPDAMIKASSSDHRNAERIADPDNNLEFLLQSAAEKYHPYSPDDASLVPGLSFNEEDARLISEYTVTIGGYVNQALVQFITGDLNIEEDWDTYISTLESMRVQDYISTYQRNYDAFIAASEAN